MRKILFVFILLLPLKVFSQEPDSIYRVMFFDSEREMLFGTSIKMHDSVIELLEFNTGKNIFIKKELIDYIKTPHGYISFDGKIRKVSLSGNRSIRVILLGGTGISGKYNYLGDKYKDHISGAGSLEIDFNPWRSKKLQSTDFRFGIGAEYLVPRGIKNINGKLSFLSFFGLAKVCFMNGEEVSPGIYSRYGVNSFMGSVDFPGNENLSGSYYFSAGLYLAFNSKFEIRGAYTINKGYIEVNKIQNVVKYQTFDVNFGVVIR